ncbi:peptidase associated/transthyretin-like domain-containing protein [Sphingobacterium cellulitidis]|uniref:hypothetical protein n=1 Tax=Sphingobacterium cellulitidis TaxID=1768011 RepID=UPI000B93E215|nr:hypothetical protein CHT99_11050 [Sphingobacterium cellulitidis]
MYNKLKYIALLCSFFFLALAAHAQDQDNIVSGLVLEKGTSTRISDANVVNQRTKQTVRTNSYGVFNIEVNVGDTLSVSKVGYGPIKTRINTLEDILLDLQAGNRIETVVVTRSTKEMEMKEMLEDYESKGVYNGGQNKFGTYISSPATALYNLFGKEAKNAKRFEKFMNQELEETKVDRIFNKTIVSKITKLEGEELQSFMDIYRPSYATAERWGQYDLMNYINSSYKTWNAQGRPKSQRLPKLEIPPQEK